MARFIYAGNWKDGQGAVVPSGTITVYLAGTTTLATAYDAETGSALSGSQTTTDSAGVFHFWIDDGDYAATQKFRFIGTKTGFSNLDNDQTDNILILPFMLVNDTSPQLGGDLDLNGNNIDFPTTANISDCLDEDDMASDSATMLATQQSIKAYVDGISEFIGIAASDETTALTTGAAKATFRMPYAFTLTDVRASVTTAPTGSTIIVDINESGSTILSTKLTIDASETTSTTAATAVVISDTALADDASITIDIDQIGSGTAGAGLKVYLIGTKA
jgi:hypothetical protein